MLKTSVVLFMCAVACLGQAGVVTAGGGGYVPATAPIVPTGPTSVYNSGNVNINGGTSGNTNIGRKLSQTVVANSGAVAIGAAPQYVAAAPVVVPTPAPLAGPTVVDNSGAVTINGGTSGNTNIGRRLQGATNGGLFVSNSGAVNINGGTSGNTNIGRRLQGAGKGGLFVSNSGAVNINGGTSGNTNIGRRLQGAGKGGLFVSNSGAVNINGGTSGNTNIGRKL